MATTLTQAEESYRKNVCSAVAVQRYRDTLAASTRVAVENYRKFTRDPMALLRFERGLEASINKAVREFEAFACNPEAVEEAARMYAAGFKGAFGGPELTASERRRRRGLREEDGF